MKRALAFLALLTLINSAKAELCPAPDFDIYDKALAVSAATAMAMDWRQTQVIAMNPGRWRELNPVLGEHPSIGQVNRHFLWNGLLMSGIAYCLPSTWRKGYLVAVTAVEVSFARHNYNLGIRFGF